MRLCSRRPRRSARSGPTCRPTQRSRQGRTRRSARGFCNYSATRSAGCNRLALKRRPIRFDARFRRRAAVSTQWAPQRRFWIRRCEVIFVARQSSSLRSHRQILNASPPRSSPPSRSSKKRELNSRPTSRLASRSKEASARRSPKILRTAATRHRWGPRRRTCHYPKTAPPCR